jgi:hypothetical protein
MVHAEGLLICRTCRTQMRAPTVCPFCVRTTHRRCTATCLAQHRRDEEARRE